MLSLTGQGPSSKDAVSRTNLKPNPGWIAVVSGLPRSGTSLMMGMLQAGGLVILSDEQRPPDASNPRGYFELEAVKSLPEETSWLRDASGKAVKVQAYLLPLLPSGFEYRVIFLQRDPVEIAASQDQMLRRRRQSGTLREETPVDLTARHLAATLAWLALSGLRSMRVDYARLVASPLADAHRVNAFLDRSLDVAAMRRVVDPGLYRQRRPAPAWEAPPPRA